VADLGSGFSSMALPVGSGSAEVWSVDDDAERLRRTDEFLAAQGMPGQRLDTWDDCIGTAPLAGFDLVVHDLGSMRTRLEALPQVIALVAPGGILVLDDMHKGSYAQAAASLIRAAGFDRYSLRRFTRDRLGRFASPALAPPG
jgi:predicted O-methyltransferase YrrM